MLSFRKAAIESVRFRLARVRMGVRERLAKRVKVRDEGFTYRFHCRTLDEYSRAQSFMFKEPGTVEWLRRSLQPGHVFYDIGANMGIYTIPAAHRVGPAGHVCAFEPHVGNLEGLLRNVSGNGVTDRVTVVGMALHSTSGTLDFRYSDLDAGTAMSQLARDRDAFGEELAPVATELKRAAALDELIAEVGLPAPDYVKLDVDGNELEILKGMAGLLGSDKAPAGIQVEVNMETDADLLEFLKATGYTLHDRHLSIDIERQVAKGADPDSVPFNGVFERSLLR
jgi:FkbM family methyltransferase